VRIDLLERGDRDTKAWLAHVDALQKGDAYRGDSLPKDALFEVVANDKLTIDVRVAAGRLLARRDGESGRAITKDVTAGEVKTRIAAVLEGDADTAADTLDVVGPLFKTG
jgi:hypothetical protein